MYAFLKLVGVPAETVGRLHEAVKLAECKPAYGSVKPLQGQLPPSYVSIEGSKFDPEHGTYTITLKINWSVMCTCMFESHPWDKKAFDFQSYFKAGLLASIMQSVDPNIVKEEEQYIAVDEKAAEIQLDHERKRRQDSGELKVRALLSRLVGKTLTRDLLCEDGSVLEKAGMLFDNDNIWSFNRFRVKYGSEISLDGQDDPELVSVLREIREIYQVFSDWKKGHGFTD